MSSLITKLQRIMMMKMMMNCFCGMVDRRKAFNFISSRDLRQRSSPSRISDTPRAGFEPAQNLSSGLVEWSWAVETTKIDPGKIHTLLSSITQRVVHNEPFRSSLRLKLVEITLDLKLKFKEHISKFCNIVSKKNLALFIMLLITGA